LAGACGRSGGSTPGAGPTPLPTSFPSAATSATLVGAGDIAVCGSPGAADTARLLDGIPGTIFTAGDNAYPNGRIEDFRDCYGPSWGRHKDRTRPSPGNHDYESPGAAPYFQYFGLNAGPAGRGYYSYGIGAWTAYSLNSNVSMATASGQVSWLRGELTETVSECSVAYWHHPLFSSGHNGNNPQARDLWRALHQAGVDIVINGHEHLYERFAPQDPEGRPDATRGIRQFTVGTGGASLTTPTRRAANSEMVVTDHGILKLRLDTGSYVWEFITADGRVRDFGTGACH
jgi:hypothetical protein